MIGEMGISQGCVKIYCDSQSAIHLANHHVYHERTKHIDIRLHFVRDMIETKEIMVEKMASEENPADMFTKSLSRSRFKHCLDLINFIEAYMKVGESSMMENCWKMTQKHASWKCQIRGPNGAV